jgi:hypothetical protein
MARALAYRWFTDPAERQLFPAEDHPRHSRAVTAQLLAAHTRDSTDPHITALVDTLQTTSAEFSEIWSEHPVIGPYCEPKRIEHPKMGSLDLHGQSLVDPDQSQILTVFTAPPGSESDNKLQFLSILGGQFVCPAANPRGNPALRPSTSGIGASSGGTSHTGLHDR